VNEYVTILMATYNGRQYLSEQIDSILNQAYPDWQLIVRDDGSDDGTVQLLAEYVKNDPRIHLVEDDLGRLGAVGNFSQLCVYANNLTSSYYCFSDQDDVWFVDKVKNLLKLMREMEKKHSIDTPFLIYSDLNVVDQNLSLMHRSNMRVQRLFNESDSPLSVLLAQNYVTGCAVMINKPLLDIALPISKEIAMHDWWLALCAAVFGSIGFIDEPLLKYRQHGNNEVGAKHLSDFLNPITGKWKKRWLEGRDNLFQSMKQAEALAERIRERDPHNPNLALVEAYASLQGTSRWQRIKKIKQLGVHAQSNSRQALLLSRLLLTSKAKYG